MIRKVTNPPSRAPREKPPAGGAKAAKRAAAATAKPAVVAATKAFKPRAQSKTALVIGLLEQAGGVSLDELIAATGWQSHSVRAALTTLRHKRHAIERTTVEGVSRYAIAQAAKS